MNGVDLRFNGRFYIAQMFPLKVEHIAGGDVIIRVFHIQQDVDLGASIAIHDFVIVMLHVVFLAHRAVAHAKQIGLPARSFFTYMDQRGSFRRIVPIQRAIDAVRNDNRIVLGQLEAT